MGAAVIEVNPNATELSHLADVIVRAGCRDALTEIDAAWRRIAS
jgi:NAD-dependent SIR2 family protein deacetylase